MPEGGSAAPWDRPRRELGAAVLLCLAGACVVLLGAGRAWTSLDVPSGPLTGPRTTALSGADLLPGLRALGLVGLAGVVALAATRRTGRLVVGLLLLLAGAAVLATAVGTDLVAASLRTEATGGAGTAVRTSAWPWVTAAGGLLLGLAGGLTLWRGRSWPGLGQRYEAPGPAGGGRPTPPAAGERALWEALDRGEDPTAP